MPADLIERFCDCCGTVEHSTLPQGPLCTCRGFVLCLDCTRCRVHCACDNGLRASEFWVELQALMEETTP